jgi:hypothetical protein
MQGNKMRLSYPFIFAWALLTMLEGCNAAEEDTWPSPNERQVSSKLPINLHESLVVAVTSSGGGAGDITYRLLDCKSGDDKCELLASIDTNDNVPPALANTRDGIALTVNRGDYVADFRNFSREQGSLEPGKLFLQYR